MTRRRDHFHSVDGFPARELVVAIEPERRGDEHQLAEACPALRRTLRARDPAMPPMNRLVGMGDSLRVLTDRMMALRSCVKTRRRRPLSRAITLRPRHHRHNKQTGRGRMRRGLPSHRAARAGPASSSWTKSSAARSRPVHPAARKSSGTAVEGAVAAIRCITSASPSMMQVPLGRLERSSLVSAAERLPDRCKRARPCRAHRQRDHRRAP